MELKALNCLKLALIEGVPNLPCGVERKPYTQEDYYDDYKFLIYRVELKD